jgi:hypothetical protein
LLTRNKFQNEALPRLTATSTEQVIAGCRLLEENTPIGKSKIFRSARAMLGVKSHQKPGRRVAGWVWSLPDQETSEAQPAAHPTDNPSAKLKKPRLNRLGELIEDMRKAGRLAKGGVTRNQITGPAATQ